MHEKITRGICFVIPKLSIIERVRGRGKGREGEGEGEGEGLGLGLRLRVYGVKARNNDQREQKERGRTQKSVELKLGFVKVFDRIDHVAKRFARSEEVLKANAILRMRVRS